MNNVNQIVYQMNKIVGMRIFAYQTQFEVVALDDNALFTIRRWVPAEEIEDVSLIDEYQRECAIRSAVENSSMDDIQEIYASHILDTQMFVAMLPNTGFNFIQYKVVIPCSDLVFRDVYIVYGPKA